jgi:hypothetical protein
MKIKKDKRNKRYTVNILSGAYGSANTLTNLIPDIYAALDVVSRELVGFIPSVMMNASAERAAVGQAIVYPVSPAATAGDTTPAMTIPEPTDQNVGNDSMTISKSRNTSFGFVGEEQRGLNLGGGVLTLQQDFIAQALRKLCNEVEVDLAVEAAANASVAYGTGGTTPFASDLSAAAEMKKLLDDAGAAGDRSLVIDTTAGVKLRTLTQLTKVNEAGTAMTLRQGELLDLFGLSTKESAQVQRTTAGTAASATTNNAGYAVGATTITLASAGTGTILAGDFVSFAGDATKYRVVTGDADVSGGGSITIAAPGLKVAIPASTTAITVAATARRNIAFSRNALHLVTRAPALPSEGDMAIDRMLITDPRSGLTFEVSIYPGYRKVRYEIALAWGVKAVKKEHLAALLG